MQSQEGVVGNFVKELTNGRFSGRRKDHNMIEQIRACSVRDRLVYRHRDIASDVPSPPCTAPMSDDELDCVTHLGPLFSFSKFFSSLIIR